ncbi:MAG: secretion system protein, partial [Sphingomonas sp.]
ETTVELGSGESMVIAGLLQNSHDNSIEKTPGLGDVPVLGALFRSNSFRRNETELVIVVTPYLVKPVNANQIVLPTDGYRGATDAQRLLGGQSFGGKSDAARPGPTMAPPATVTTPPATAAAPAPRRREGGKAAPAAAPGFSL